MAAPFKKHLSISQINMLSRCAEQWRRRYDLGEKIPPGFSRIVGKVVDGTSTTNLTGKMKGEGLMSIEAVGDMAADAFGPCWEEEEKIAEAEVVLTEQEAALGVDKAAGLAKDKSIRLAQLHAREFAPIIQPTHLQRRIEVELPGYPYDLLGYLDIQEGLRAIRDTKTAAKTPAKDIADRDDQLTMYAMMVYKNDGTIPDALTLDYLIDLKTPKATVFATKRTVEDFDPLLRRVEVASLALEKGVFVPARETDWWCSERWCGYFSSCAYVKRSRRLNV